MKFGFWMPNAQIFILHLENENSNYLKIITFLFLLGLLLNQQPVLNCHTKYKHRKIMKIR